MDKTININEVSEKSLTNNPYEPIENSLLRIYRANHDMINNKISKEDIEFYSYQIFDNCVKFIEQKMLEDYSKNYFSAKYCEHNVRKFILDRENYIIENKQKRFLNIIHTHKRNIRIEDHEIYKDILNMLDKYFTNKGMIVTFCNHNTMMTIDWKDIIEKFHRKEKIFSDDEQIYSSEKISSEVSENTTSQNNINKNTSQNDLVMEKLFKDTNTTEVSPKFYEDKSLKQIIDDYGLDSKNIAKEVVVGTLSNVIKLVFEKIAEKSDDNVITKSTSKIENEVKNTTKSDTTPKNNIQSKNQIFIQTKVNHLHDLLINRMCVRMCAVMDDHVTGSIILSKGYYRYPTFGKNNRPGFILGFSILKPESLQDFDTSNIERCVITCNELVLKSDVNFTDFFTINEHKYYFDVSFCPIPLKYAYFNNICINIKLKNNINPPSIRFATYASAGTFPSDLDCFNFPIFLKDRKGIYHIKVQDGTCNYLDGYKNYKL